MVNRRLVYYLEHNKILSPFQSSFRPGRCTIDNLLALETDIRTTFLKRQHLVAIFFDIEKAYDRTWRYGILQDLFNCNLRGNLPIFIQNFLRLRQFRVKVGYQLSDPFIQEEGVPQGSVLSVALFALKINSIFKHLQPSIKSFLYVDDLYISCSGDNMAFIERQLQIAVKKLTQWSILNGFTFSTSKTSCVHFCRKRRLHPEPEIKLYGQVINVWATNRIEFHNIKVSNLFSTSGETFHSVSPFLVERAITGSIGDVKFTKKLRSGDLLIEVQSRKQSEQIVKLKTFSNILITVSPHATLNSSKGVITCGELLNVPTEEILKELQGQGVSHVRRISIRRDGQPLNTKHLILTFDSAKLPENIKAGYMRLSVRTYIPNPLRCFKCQRFGHSKTSCRGTLTCARCAEDGHESTDCTRAEKHRASTNGGSPSVGKSRESDADAEMSSSSFSEEYVLEYNMSEDLEDSLVVISPPPPSKPEKANRYKNRVEIMVILHSLSEISNYPAYNYIIYSDSLSVLQALSLLHRHSHPLAFSILYLYDHLMCKGFSILLCWVPSHVGISGNEIADTAAKNASAVLDNSTPLKDFKHYINLALHSIWENHWSSLSMNKLRSIKPVVKPWPTLTNRKADTIVTRLRVGHTRYTHRHLLMGEQAPMCTQCNCIMSVLHILSECPNFNSLRLRYFQSSSISLTDLLGKTPHVHLLPFLKSIGFYPLI
ncbi:hypothetical protein AVEN_252363-1 [Araneus ventricosus]|uniref:RNA-directed DNA polymerase from transposon BS n=1 Tax=Araneus ventricosus TaxID=182803 RepID=A0A4Y2ARP1_ARAVE|nr:hypothetical protein AVEN_252363-1 [Araneus ventricosus]